MMSACICVQPMFKISRSNTVGTNICAYCTDFDLFPCHGFPVDFFPEDILC